MIEPAAQRIADFFGSLAPADLARLGEIYSDDARFKDPFNEVVGVPAIRQVFEHMFTTLDAPRFVVRELIVQGPQCFLTWDFVFRMRRFNRREQVIRGSSHLVLAADGRITLHRDYWDAAEELYEKLPLLGSLMRWLRKRVSQ